MTRIVQAIMQKSVVTLMCISILLSISGCVVPYPQHEIYEGTEIAANALAWVKPGITTRTQIYEKLGNPNIEFAEQGVVAYLWSGQVGGILLVSNSGADTIPLTMRRSLLILFNNDDIVVDYTFRNRPSGPAQYNFNSNDLDNQPDNWRYILAQWQKERNHNKSMRQSGKTHD